MPSWAQIKQRMQQNLLLSQAEEFGRRLAHQFPWSPSASVALGLALRRRYLGQVGAPSLAAHRKQIIKVHHHTLCSLAMVACLMLCRFTSRLAD